MFLKLKRQKSTQRIGRHGRCIEQHQNNARLQQLERFSKSDLSSDM